MEFTSSTLHLESLQQSESEVIFMIGLPNAGKTSFLLAITNFLRNNSIDYQFVFNTFHNEKGAYYINSLWFDLFNHGRLPARTKEREILIVDLYIKYNGGEKYLTFIDTAGEDLDLFKKGISFNKDLTPYFQTENQKISFICFVDSTNSFKDSSNLHLFLSSLLGSKFRNNLSKMCLVLTKWDEQDPSLNVMEYLSTSNDLCGQCYNLMKKFVSSPECFNFSVGEIDKNDSQKIVDKLDERYCQPVMDWILSDSINSTSPYYLNRQKKSRVMQIFSSIRSIGSLILSVISFTNKDGN